MIENDKLKEVVEEKRGNKCSVCDGFLMCSNSGGIEHPIPTTLLKVVEGLVELVEEAYITDTPDVLIHARKLIKDERKK